MQAEGVGAATLEIRKRNGDVLLHQGYGWLDAGRTRQTRPDTMMRIMSITKSFVHLAINQLAASGTISKNAKAFCLNNETPSATGCLLRVTPAGGDGIPDPNAKNITVQHLLDHKAGWDGRTPDANGVHEPIFSSITIAGILNVPSPPTWQQMISYQLDQPLDYTPGTGFVYSNFGYVVLSQIIEEYSGLDFMGYIHEHITDDLGIPQAEIELGKELVAQRNPREPRYISADGALVQNVFDPEGPRVLAPDGGFLVERAGGASAIVTTASVLMDYMRAYRLVDPVPRDLAPDFENEFHGSLDGTRAIVVQNNPLPGYQTQADYALIMNRWPASDSPDLRSRIKNTLIKNVAHTGNTGIGSGAQQFFTLYVPEDSEDLEFITQGGTGDIDFYVRFGARPTTSIFDCRSVAAGASHVCTIPNPSGGTWHALILGNTAYSGISITGDYEAD